MRLLLLPLPSKFSACESIVLVSGGSYPDALCASGLAGVLEAPILLTSSTSLSEPAYDEIVRLNAEHIIIVGGENSVSSEIELELEQNGFSVSRIAGADRYETSYNVYKAATNSWGSRSGSNSKTAIIVSGSNYADALSASSYAWWSTSPIFLVNGNGLTEKVKVSIAEDGFARAIVVGGASSVSASLGDDLKSIGISVKRLSGNDRYETSVAFATWALGEGMSFNNAGIATGKNFPDALAGGALCGKCSSVILLADIDGGTQAVDTLATHKDEISRLYYLGGENSVTPELCNLIESALKG